MIFWSAGQRKTHLTIQEIDLRTIADYFSQIDKNKNAYINKYINLVRNQRLEHKRYL